MELKFHSKNILFIFVSIILLLNIFNGCIRDNFGQSDNVLDCMFICNLIDERANDVGIKGTDLGVGVERDNEIWLIFGDVVGMNILKNGASAVALLSKDKVFDFSRLTWKMDEDGNYYKPLHSKRVYGDVSTVPAGAVEIDGIMYIYAMRVEWWNHGPKQTHAWGVLFRENETNEFHEVFNWSRDERVNNAPILVDDTIYMVYTNLYRNSAVYLSCVDKNKIGDKNSYRYFSGRTDDGEPIWSENIEDAIPLEGTEKMRVGEISFAYNPILDMYFIMFDSFSIKNGGFWLYYSKKPYGPYSRVKVGVLKDDSWLQENWSGCYGGYIIPYMFGDDGKELYFTISVWKPYITVVMKTRFDVKEN